MLNLSGGLISNDVVVISLRQGPLVNEFLISKGVSDLVQGSSVNLVQKLVLAELVVWLDPGVVLGVLVVG